LGTMDCGLWTMDDGPWTMDCGQWMMDHGLWTMDNGPWTVDNGLWTMVDRGEYMARDYRKIVAWQRAHKLTLIKLFLPKKDSD